MFQQTYSFRHKAKKRRTKHQHANTWRLQGTAFSSGGLWGDLSKILLLGCKKSNLVPVLLKHSLSTDAVSQLFPSLTYISQVRHT